MHVGAAIAVVILAITGLASLWFARTLGKGRFELINGFKPEKRRTPARSLASCESAIPYWAGRSWAPPF